jgi:hypothetical protein
MKKRRNRSAPRSQPSKRRKHSIVFIVFSAVVLAGIGWWLWSKTARSRDALLTVVTHPTFNRDIAPIVFRNCAPCHRPGQPGPFSLLTYGDAQKRARQIADLTSQRIMPPWQAADVGVKYLGERRLTDSEIAIIKRWVEQGSVEGAPGDLPPQPKWNEGWQLGAPDLVLEMPEPFTLPAEGRDVYHNFVLPARLPTRQFVAAMELHVGNKAVHHAGIHLDATPESRLRDAKEPGPGFAGMELPASVSVPDGHFLSWQPGRDAYQSPAGLPWTLEPNTDLVLQLHMQPTGKPEAVRCKIGLYFTNRPPTNAMLKVLLTSVQLKIPAGEKNFVVEDSYALPVDVEVLGVKPHVHYLGKDLRAFATLPDGSCRELLHIPDWDFNWQQDYRFAAPMHLPRGTRLQMRFSYDNSADNSHNPHRPPRDVRYGVQTTDEMAELWLQVLADNANDLRRLTYDFSAKAERDAISFYEWLLRENPRDAKALTSYGRLLILAGRIAEAEQHLRAALEIIPADDLPHYYLGVVHRRQNQLSAAREEFETALRLNAENYRAHGNLAQIAQAEGNLDAAEHHLRAALKIHPGDTLSRETLDEILRARGLRP